MVEEKSKLAELKRKIKQTKKMLGIDRLRDQVMELERRMQARDFWIDTEKAAQVSKEHEDLKKEIETWNKLSTEVEELFGLAEELENNSDSGLEKQLAKRVGELEKEYDKLEFFRLFSGRYDNKNAIISVHAGSGGTEARDWAEMIARMLLRYAEKKGFKTIILDQSKGSEAGIKSITFSVQGRYAYGHFKSEHGTHRLVRVSPFDAEKMRHTSFALAEVVPELREVDVEIDPNDLRVDTYRSGGAGGQSVNKTSSAVRIVHLPTNITVQCQNERSQHQNKEMAMTILLSKLQQLKEEQEKRARQKIIGEHKQAQWGNQIRSYVLHPYKMVKDLRSRYQESDPDKVLDGDLDGFVEAYLRYLKQQTI